jgi:hypothetical protein
VAFASIVAVLPLCSTDPYVIEHIRPKVRGGKTSLRNLAYACSGCNGHKHAKVKARDPVTEKQVWLFNPRRHVWEQHFAWNEDYTHIIGLTDIGRATVEALQLNRLKLINLRRVLHAVKLHPPA